MAERRDVPAKKLLARRLFVPDHGLTLPTTQTQVTQLQSQTPSSSSSHSEWKSPRLKQRTNAEVNGGIPKKQKCNCKHSKCLKLYCECFASGNNCNECNCTNCHNNFEHEAAKQEAVKATLERKPNAFRSKIVGSPHCTKDKEEAVDMSLVGKPKRCNCKKSECVKKYCECFHANIPCSIHCKCRDCKNFVEVNSHGRGSPPLTKRIQGLQHPQSQQEPPMNPSALPPILTTGSSKLTYRSLLADVIQPEDIKKLCSSLTMKTASLVLSDKNEIDGQATKDKSDESNSMKVNQMSPGTLALMCNEKDPSFSNSSSKLYSLHQEQERVVLTDFLDCLNKIIVVGQNNFSPARPPP